MHKIAFSYNRDVQLLCCYKHIMNGLIISCVILCNLLLCLSYFLLTFHFILYFHDHSPSQHFQGLHVSYCFLCCSIRSVGFLNVVSLICPQLYLKYFSVWIFHCWIPAHLLYLFSHYLEVCFSNTQQFFVIVLSVGSHQLLRLGPAGLWILFNFNLIY